MGRIAFGIFVFPMGLIALANLLLGTRPGAWAVVNVLSYPLLTVLVLATHEAGHALTGRALGLSVPRVDLGVGRAIRRWRWRQTTIRIHALPLVGLTYLGSERETEYRWRLWVTTAAGPAVTLGLLVVTWLLPTPLTLERMVFALEAVATRPAPRELLAFHSGIVLLGSLWPNFRAHRLGRRANDGTALLHLPFASAAQLRDGLVVTALLEADDLREHGDVNGAQRVLEQMLARAPESFAVLNSLAVVALDQGRLAEARAMFLGLVARESRFPSETWVARNNLAWVDFCLRDPDLRAEADEHSAAVARHFKDEPWAMGTRGAVLVWLGRYVDALPLLKRAYLLHSSSRSRALNACCLAWALAALGWPDDGRRWLQRARANHSSCPLLGDAEAALAPPRPG